MAKGPEVAQDAPVGGDFGLAAQALSHVQGDALVDTCLSGGQAPAAGPRPAGSPPSATGRSQLARAPGASSPWSGASSSRRRRRARCNRTLAAASEMPSSDGDGAVGQVVDVPQDDHLAQAPGQHRQGVGDARPLILARHP